MPAPQQDCLTTDSQCVDEGTRSMINDLLDRVRVLEAQRAAATTAFSNNDLGAPDYDGHRRAHILIADDAKVLAGFKQEATKNVIRTLVTVLLTLLASGFFTDFGKILTKIGTP